MLLMGQERGLQGDKDRHFLVLLTDTDSRIFYVKMIFIFRSNCDRENVRFSTAYPSPRGTEHGTA